MKVSCSIIRDLMPLVVDCAASDESAALVGAHVAACPACAACMEAMRAEVSGSVQEPRDEIALTAQRLRRRHRRRVARIALMGLIVGALLALGGYALVDMLTSYPIQPAPLEEYTCSFSQLDDGRLIAYGRYLGRKKNWSLTWTDVEATDGAERIVYLTVEQPMAGRTADVDRWRETLAAEEFGVERLKQIAEIRKGAPERYETLWQNGQAIPDASEQMEQYYAILAQIEALPMQETEDGRAFPVDRTKAQRLEAALGEAQARVPEWQ